MKTTLEEIRTEIVNDNPLLKKGLIIAGPCSAESEDQLIKTAIELAQLGKTDVLRAGIWKPRTNPGGFEGVGTKGLSWLLNAKRITNLKTAAEVATSKHVEDALSFDVDILWVGARTTVNPFSVQQISDALKGTDQTVLIKNPVNPDIKLWIGAIERLQKSGIKKIGLIHRGFSSYGNTEYRNTPMWQIPIEMKRLFPELPMICDPSHICGNTQGLLAVSQKSVNLDYDGLIIETHYAPEIALTDKDQQITPRELSDLLDKLIIKKSRSDEETFLKPLENLREQINDLDEELISLISNRMKIAKEIGRIKKKSNITVLQSLRYNEILERLNKKGEKLGLSEQFIRSYMEAIHIESIRTQNIIGQ
jgi:chorismate mutase